MKALRACAVNHCEPRDHAPASRVPTTATEIATQRHGDAQINSGTEGFVTGPHA
jgi:hypothetical protein